MKRYDLHNKRALTIAEAAEYACVSRGTINNWLVKGILPYEELPSGGDGSYRFLRIRKQDIDELLNRSYNRNELKSSNKTNNNELILLPQNF